MTARDGYCPGYVLSADSFSRTSVEAYAVAALAERDRVVERLEAARQRCKDAQALLRRLDALAGGAAGPDLHSSDRVRADG
jgi:hypothetical protein